MSKPVKKGDKSQCENCRGILITNSISRLYEKILKITIENEYCKINTKEHAGDKKIAFKQEIHILYIDLRKTYEETLGDSTPY